MLGTLCTGLSSSHNYFCLLFHALNSYNLKKMCWARPLQIQLLISAVEIWHFNVTCSGFSSFEWIFLLNIEYHSFFLEFCFARFRRPGLPFPVSVCALHCWLNQISDVCSYSGSGNGERVSWEEVVKYVNHLSVRCATVCTSNVSDINSLMYP